MTTKRSKSGRVVYITHAGLWIDKDESVHIANRSEPRFHVRVTKKQAKQYKRLVAFISNVAAIA